MVKVYKSQIVTETSQGEITINLNLTVTINQDGSLNVGVNAAPKKETYDVPEIPDSKFIVPEFESTSELLPDFGEEVGR